MEERRFRDYFCLGTVTGKLIIQESLSETQCTLAVQKNDDAADPTNAGRDGSLPYVHAQMCQNKMADSVNKYVYLTNEALKTPF